MGLKVCMHGVEMSPSKENVVAGGIPNSVIQLLKTLNGFGMELIFVTNDRKFREIGEKTNNFSLPEADVQLILVEGIYADSKYLLEYFFKTIKKIAQINKERNLDIIHGHSGHLGLAIVTEAASRFTRIPAVHTIYCPVKMESKVRFIYKYVLKDIKKIIAISDNVKSSLNKIGISNDKIVVIPPLIDFSVFKPNVGGEKLRDTLGIGAEFTILYLGNLTKTKGIDTVLDALNIVKKQFPNIKLLSGVELTHSGTDARKKEILNKINKYNLMQNITELGLISNVEKVMDAADVVVAPFRNTYEVADYPLVVLESMAVGTPVITTRVGGIPEILKNGENGILINPDDPTALAYGIINLINNREKRRELSESASSFVREKIRERDIAEMTKQIYEEILHE